MSREQAHAVLDSLKRGETVPMQEINAALVATGDLVRWTPPKKTELTEQI